MCTEMLAPRRQSTTRAALANSAFHILDAADQLRLVLDRCGPRVALACASFRDAKMEQVDEVRLAMDGGS
jgi:hypothetical protein